MGAGRSIDTTSRSEVVCILLYVKSRKLREKLESLCADVKRVSRYRERERRDETAQDFATGGWWVFSTFIDSLSRTSEPFCLLAVSEPDIWQRGGTWKRTLQHVRARPVPSSATSTVWAVEGAGQSLGHGEKYIYHIS